MICRQPCPTCPWRIDRDASTIPGFDLELAERLDRTSQRNGYGPAYGDPMFACHQSKAGEEIVCAGWLAVEGHAHPLARLNVMLGKWPVEAFEPGDDWPDLHTEFAQVIEKLRETA